MEKKPKNAARSAAARAMAKARWAGTTKAQRSEAGRAAITARWAKKKVEKDS